MRGHRCTAVARRFEQIAVGAKADQRRFIAFQHINNWRFRNRQLLGIFRWPPVIIFFSPTGRHDNLESNCFFLFFACGGASAGPGRSVFQANASQLNASQASASGALLKGTPLGISSRDLV
jgi:hypothetical protein